MVLGMADLFLAITYSLAKAATMFFFFFFIFYFLSTQLGIRPESF